MRLAFQQQRSQRRNALLLNWNEASLSLDSLEPSDPIGRRQVRTNRPRMSADNVTYHRFEMSDFGVRAPCGQTHRK